MRRVLRVSLALIVVAIGVLAWRLFATLPHTSGTLAMPGLQAPVTVARDDHGIPTISAANSHDAYAALGFVHAQDRFWQMETQRRAGAGRLSEVVGPEGLPVDRMARVLGLYRLAEASLSHLRPEVREALQAYADGVNAWLADAVLPPEALVLRHRPEPWRLADTLVWGRIMALQLAGNWSDELELQQVLQRLPADKARMLWLSEPADGLTTVSLDASRARAMLAAIPPLFRFHLASNVWAVAGSRSVSGKPILANDPHLEFSAPILWYLATVQAPGLYVSGATIPGVPFHMIGHNRRVAWGITTTHADMMDLFIEREAGDGRYETPTGPQPYETRQETILVRGSEPVVLTVRTSRHGPIVSDLIDPQGQILALASATLLPDDTTVQAFHDLNRAADWPEFREALRGFHAPMLNIAVADTAGRIGFMAAGRIPIRRAGDGTIPHTGWQGAFDWIGWVAFDDLPTVTDPPSGTIVNANNRVAPSGYPHLIAAQWEEPFRAQRILEMLERPGPHDAAVSQAMQHDEVTPLAAAFRPVLEGLSPEGEAARAARDRLLAWDGRMARDLAEPLIFDTWLRQLQQELIGDDLGDLAQTFDQPRPYFLLAALRGEGGWCEDRRTEDAESCRELAGRAFADTVEELVQRLGDDPDRWRWGQVHRARFDNAVLGRLPLVGQWASLSISSDGGDFTVNRGTVGGDDDDPWAHVHGAGLRAVYDLAQPDASRFILATGQSGNPLSSHYADQLEPWRDGALLAIGPGAPVAQLLRLEPR
jgi:penicillin amidase